MTKNIKIIDKVPRRERKIIRKLYHSGIYKYILGFTILFFSPVKKFIILPFSAARKACGVVSLSIYKILGLKIGYIDDFIVHKKLRGKGYGKKLFDETQKQAQKDKCDFLVLFSRKDRKASHKFYKKAGLTIIGLGVGIFAYKKFKHKK